MTDRPDVKLPVELLLSQELVQEAKEILGDLSAPVEDSLRRRVEQEKLRRDPNFQARLAATIDLALQFHQQHGLWGEEFSTL